MLERKDWAPDAVVQLVGVVLAAFAGGSLLAQLGAAMLRAQGVSIPSLWVLLLGMVFFQGMSAAALVAFVRRQSRHLSEAFGFGSRHRSGAARVGLVAGLAMLPVAYGSLAGVQALLRAAGHAAPPQETVALLTSSPSTLARLGLMASSVVGAPLVEEAFFRGVLFAFVRDLGWPRVAWVGTSMLFGLVHGNLAAWVPLTLLGLVLARIYERTGSLWAPVVAHGIFNLAPFVVLMLGLAQGFAIEPAHE